MLWCACQQMLTLTERPYGGRMEREMINIDLYVTRHDDGYNVADWFRGGLVTIETAEMAPTPVEADRILRAAYLGPDVDGVEVRWTIG